MTNGKHKDIKYRAVSFRLSDEIIEKLKMERQNFKSWNLLFRDLLQKYDEKL